MSEVSNSDLMGFHLMAKPVGAACNLDCSYCFYLDKQNYYPAKSSLRMNHATLNAYIENYINSQISPEVEFTWQGGEPTLIGLEFYQTAVELQKKFANGKIIRNTLQTNGTLLDDEWCKFFAKENFLIGISLDGPAFLNDKYRLDKQARSTFAAVLNSIQNLQLYKVEYNVLVTVANEVAKHPLLVYQFLLDLGVRYIQFNPVVERVARINEQGLNFAQPPKWPPQNITERVNDENVNYSLVSDESVDSLAYGKFLSKIFDLWVSRDVGNIHIMNFEWALAAWCNLPSGVCIFSPQCGKAAIVEHDGNIYSCDHFMYPEYRLGNVLDGNISSFITQEKQINFGKAKSTGLPEQCKTCKFLFACHGECPKNRFAVTISGEKNLNYLCSGYFYFFNHITPAMNIMSKLLAEGKDSALIMLQK